MNPTLSNSYSNATALRNIRASLLPYQLNPEFSKFRKVTTNSCRNNNLPQIAIKKKFASAASHANTEVVLLNGNWDTSYKIPNIIAEMHNVDIDELQALKTTASSSEGGKPVMLGASTPSPLGSDSGIEGDCSDGNLSWLLNYRINELPPVPDSSSVEHPSITNGSTFSENRQAIIPTEYHRIGNQQVIPLNHIAVHKPAHCDKVVHATSNVQQQEKPPGQVYRYSGPKKPPFTYTELIEYALVEKGELTVSGIYQWISDHFPFYKQNDDKWKNSVRHNLSINPHFRKGSKAVHGAGHLWTIAQKGDQKAWTTTKQRMQQFMQTTMSEYSKQKQQEIELATATASIIPQDEFVQNSSRLQPQNVEVEYVIDMSGGLGDFLCPPVTKEQVAAECGLGGDYLITDLNPAALGLNLGEAEIMNGANLYDDLNFQCYELQTD